MMRRFRSTHAICAALSAVLASIACSNAGISSRASASESAAKSPPAKSLDDQLLDDLDPDPLTDKDVATPAARDAKSVGDTVAPTGKAPTDDSLDQELLKGLNDGEDLGQPSEQNPLGRLNQQMREVESRIAGSRSDRDTQQLQAKILQDLDVLIKETQKQCQGGNCKPGQQTAGSRNAKQPGKSSGAGQQPAEGPARESTDKLRDKPAARPDMADMKEVLKGVWGQLPEHQREQMLQSYEEQFLPKYEQMIADYFRSIAEPESTRTR